MAFTGEILWSPALNSIKFINSLDESFLDTQSLDDLAALPYMEFEGYCQKVNTGEARSIQFHSNGTTPTVRIRNWDTDAIVSTVVATQLNASEKESENGTVYPFNFYQADLTFASAGRYYCTIENTAGGTIRSEPIIVGDFTDTVLIKFSNDKNTNLNVWTEATPLELTIRVEAQFYKAMPTSSRTVFKSSSDRSLILAQKNNRGVKMDIYHIPPYMHEALGYGFSLGTINVNGQLFYSNTGYSEVSYSDRFDLANGTATLLTQVGFGEQDVTPSAFTFIVDGAGNFIVDGSDNNLIQI